MQVSGRVFDSAMKRGIENVSVSNGESIVRTDADGRYALTLDHRHDRYVFVSVPAGYRAQESFYALLDGERNRRTFDFLLVEAPERARASFRVAHLSDTHVVLDDSGAVSGEVLANDLQELVADTAPDFAIITGDLTNMGTVAELTSYRTAIESVAIPVISVFGGHDGNIERRSVQGDIQCTFNFEATLGPTYYSFDWGGYHFVVYATEDNYHSEVGRARKERWLLVDLDLQPSHRKSVVMFHTAPSPALLAELNERNVALVLHGHWHSSRVFASDKTVVASSSSFCFGGIDTRPRGCRLISFSPEGVRSELRAAAPMNGRGSEPHTESPSFGEAPAAIRIGDDTLSLAWCHGLNSPLHRAAPVSWQNHVLVSLHSDSLPIRDGISSLDSATGEERWFAPTDAAIKNSCVVISGSQESDVSLDPDRCAALTVTGQLACIDLATGGCVWRAELPSYPHRWVYSAPAHSGDTIVAGSKAGYGAFDVNTGEQKWHFAPSDGDEWPSYLRPQVYKNEICILIVQRSGILALDMADGAIAWELELPVEYFCGSPVLAGHVVVISSASPHTGASLTGGLEGDLAVLEAGTGKVRAHFSSILPGYATGLAVADNRIYASTAAGTAHCIDLETGKEYWRFQTGDDLLDMTPYRRGIQSLLAAPELYNGHVLLGAGDGRLYVLDGETGECTDSADLGAPITAAPCATPNGFCVGTYGGTLFGFHSTH